MNRENAWAGQGPVLLDIGGGFGAVVVTVPAALDGVEVEARPPDHRSGRSSHHDDAHAHAHQHGHRHSHAGHDAAGHHEAGSHWPHVAVVARPVGERLVHSLVFSELLAGTYALCVRDSADTALTVQVRDGEVTFANWPGSDLEERAGGSGSAVLAGMGPGVETAA